VGLRPGKAEDLETIVSICEAIKRIYRENEIHLWNEYYPTEEIFSEDIRDGRLYVYETDDEIVGSVSFEDTLTDDESERSHTVKYPCRLMVNPKMQNQGIGTAILQELFAMVKMQGYQEIRFLVSMNNPRAAALYQRLGCVSLGYIRTPWEEEDQKYLLFSKNLRH
jgi:ribosomal protein S18 acetylase RimI-like enzyme